jgi:Tfp pilus assembly protein PilZ
MLGSSIDRRLGHTRIVYGHAVRIIPPDQRQVIVAQASNLSEAGMFISSGEVFTIGTDLLCDVPLAADSRLALRARVAWTRAQPSGMGIEFVDLSDGDRSLLRRAIAQGHPLDWARPVKIWFEGMPQPSRAEARATPTGVVVLSELRFLRLRSRVVVCFEDDESRSGTLHDVSLRSATVPELQLAVDFDPPSVEPDATWSYRPPPPIASPPMAEEAAPAPEALIIEAELPPGVTATFDAETDGTPIVDACTEEIIIEPADDDVELVVDLTRIAGEESDADAAVAPPTTTVLSDPDDDRLPAASDTPYVIEASSDADVSHWDLQLPASETSQWQLQTEGGLVPKRRRRYAWLWAVALLMSSVTVASMAYTNLWEHVRDRLLPRPLPPPLVVSPEPTPVPASTASTLAPDEPHLAPAPSATTTVEAAATRTPTSAGGDHSRAPELIARGGRWTLVIPIRGSTAGATHYPLASPAGLAINLPRARPLLRFGEYSLKNGFRRIWVRRRGEGVHLRVFFLGDAVPTHALRLTEGSVRVELRPSP